MGNRQSKPGTDWAAIRQGFGAGISIRELARQHAPLTHRAIQKRRDKEGWDTQSATKAATDIKLAATLAATATLPSVIAQEAGQVQSQVRTEAKARIVLESLARGMPYMVAAAHAGIARHTLEAWRDADAQFAHACETAMECWHGSKLTEIDAAGARGDWKASAYRLERHHKTRETYATKGDGGTNIQVVVNVDRAKDELVTVEHKP